MEVSGLLHTPADLLPEPIDRSLDVPHSWSEHGVKRNKLALVKNQTVAIQPKCSLTELI
jgi:hypothetical protein